MWLIALRRINKGLIVVVIRRKLVHVDLQFAERHDAGGWLEMVPWWQRSEGGSCCSARQQSEVYETGDRSMLRHEKTSVVPPAHDCTSRERRRGSTSDPIK